MYDTREIKHFRMALYKMYLLLLLLLLYFDADINFC